MATSDDTSARSRLEQTIESERLKLLQANAVLKCLYEVLLHAEGDDSVTYAEAAHVAATLIDDSVGRLDRIRLRPMFEALARSASDEYPMHEADPDKDRVEESRVLYLS